MSAEHERIGVLGGTFDPIHIGHVAAARTAMDCARLDRVIFMPTGRPPHRPPAAASAEHRLEMTRLATADEAHFDVSDLELRRSGASFTSDTLRELRALYPSNEFFLILGWDAARLFSSWHEPDQVRSLATIVVVARPGSGSPEASELEAAGFGGPDTILCLEHTPDVSASAIREDVKSGRSIAGKVPPAVEEYIASHHLYVE
ncbi:MAG: nicotinate (nicotinamide) nucleotide adenylyltransferase [Chloroflexi bacterium]|nr:MAG: nicotinate (nicotinamide) nucleotide adenylyltransferase [Chloroflexota bacterium]